jgi:hypothetical protein
LPRAAEDERDEIDGSCHCGHVTFEAEADPETTTICNCTDCQTMSGAPLRAIITTRPGTLVLLSGNRTEYRKTSENGVVRPQAFCPRCGTAIYSTTVGDDPKAYNIRLDAVRQRNELVPRRQIFARSQQAWVTTLQRFCQRRLRSRQNPTVQTSTFRQVLMR